MDSFSLKKSVSRVNVITKNGAIKKNSKKRLVRYGLVFGNLLIVVAVFALISTSNSKNTTNYAAFSTAEETMISDPLDALSAADIAVNIARMTSLPEELSVVNLADDIKFNLNTTVADREFASNPQILSPDIKTKADIQQYKVKDGETVAKLAKRFGVTSDTIKWSNGLTSDTLTTGTTLTIPPSNGFMYEVGSGDTVDKLAESYKSSSDQIIVFNDIELTGLKVGSKIFIPGGQKPAPVTYSSSASSAPRTYVYRGGGGYAYGWCTYYAASRGGAPGGWGNARTWANYARVTPGWGVSKTPRVGAIAQTTRMHYLGHVAVVEEVSADGLQIRISDMNGIAGWGRVGYSGWIPVGNYDWFIARQ